MGKVSDMALDEQAGDELRCEIDHWRARAEQADDRLRLAEDACRKLVAWDDGEKAGPDYGTLERDTHPQGEKIWGDWWENQQEICHMSFNAARAFLERSKP
jgi:hypothetical protein